MKIGALKVGSLQGVYVMHQREQYHGWVIELMSDQVGYSFQCRHPDQNIVISNRRTYLTYEKALETAKLRADLESVHLSLSHFLDGKFQLFLLNPVERSALENSIVQCIDAVSHQVQ